MESGTAVNLHKADCSQKLNDHGRRLQANSEGVTSFKTGEYFYGCTVCMCTYVFMHGCLGAPQFCWNSFVNKMSYCLTSQLWFARKHFRDSQTILK